MKTKGVLCKGFRQEVSVLVLDFTCEIFKLSILNMLSQKMVTHINVLRVRVRHGVNCHLDRTLMVLENLDARIPKIRQYKNATRAAKKAPPSSLLPLQRTRSHSRKVWRTSAS